MQESDQLTLFAEASPASHFQRRESGKEHATIDIYCRRCLESYPRSSQLGLLAKMLLDSSVWQSKYRRLKWITEPLTERQTRITTVEYRHDKRRCCSSVSFKRSKRSATRSRHFIFRLAASPRLMKDTESLLWLGTPTASTKARSAEYRGRRTPNPREFAKLFPTPTASLAEHGGPRQRDSSGRPGLQMAAMLWPTPTANDVKRDSRAERNRRTPHLESVVKLLPTPTANDAKNATLPPAAENRDNLAGYLMRTMYATPQARDYRTGQTERWDDPGRSRNLNDQIGGQLNPDWVEWLMGFPRGWSDRSAAGGLPPYTDGRSQWDTEPEDLPRLAQGVPDRTARITANGNAVVPQQAYPIFKAIYELSGNSGQLK